MRHVNRVLASLLLAAITVQLVLGPLPRWGLSVAHAADEEQNTPTTAAFAEERAATSSAPAAKSPAEDDPVSATGAFATSYPFRLPPNRNGMVPSLGLSFSSDGVEAPSAFGAGWSIGVSAIRRTRRDGTPTIIDDGTHRYSDEEDGTPLFERDGAELIEEPGATDPRGRVYRDRIAYGAVRTIFHAAAPSHWLVLSPDGTRHFYGNVPDGSLPTATISDELGVTQWLLVRSQDPFGNVIDREYVQGPARAALTDMQLAPLPAKISYGKNVDTGYPHHVEVDFAYQLAAHPGAVKYLAYDHAGGHVYLDRFLAHVDVSLLPGGKSLVRRYDLVITPSSATPRYLLRSVRELAGGLAGPLTEFHYTDNEDLAFEPSAAMSASLPRFVLRMFNGPSLDFNPAQVPWAAIYGTDDEGGAPKWPMEFLDGEHFGLWERFFSPPGSLSAFSFVDLEGDSDLDVLYHPSFAAGAGYAQPWATMVRDDETATYTRFDDAYPVGASGSDPLSMHHLLDYGGEIMVDGYGAASDYVDVDLDGAADRFFISPVPFEEGEVSERLRGICEWCEDNGFCGLYDPVWCAGTCDPIPDDCGEACDEILVAGYMLDEVATALGIRGEAFQLELTSTMSTMFNEVPSGGGTTGGVGSWGSLAAFCYDIGGDSYSQDSDEAEYPNVTVERGRLHDPDEARELESGPLLGFPAIGRPTYKVDVDYGAVAGQPFLLGVSSYRDVHAPLADLDADGVPELVVLKSRDYLTSVKLGAGVWRMQHLAPVHERYLDAHETRFVDSLDEIYFTPRRTTGLAADDYSCGTQAVAPATVMSRLSSRAGETAQELDAALSAAKAPTAGVSAALAELIGGKGDLAGLFADLSVSPFLKQKLLPTVDWIVALEDVNADGLPDLVIAKGATCEDGTGAGAATDHQVGFDVHLNRGDRFETDPATGARFSGGPFDFLRNWSVRGQSLDLHDDLRIPYDALAFGDLDGDGAPEAVISARLSGVGSAAHHDSLPHDPAACARAPRQSGWWRQRCVWHVTPNGWVADAGLAAEIPIGIGPSDLDGPATMVGKTAGDVGGVAWSYTLAPNTIRLADLDNDGLNDLVSARPTEIVDGTDVYPEEQPARVLENTGERPDLLTVIDNGLGGRTTVTYRPAARDELDAMPSIPWVVAQVERNSQADGSDAPVLERTTYAFSGGRFDHPSRESLGFRHVISTRELVYPDGATGESVEVDRDFYQDEHSVDAVVVPHVQRPPRNPLRGLTRSTTIRGVGGAPTETRATTTEYEVLTELAGNALKVRRLGQSSSTCVAAGCASGEVASETTWSSFDAFDNPGTETVTVARTGFGDGFDGTDSITTLRLFQNDTAAWIIGQPFNVQVRRGLQTLSYRTFAYHRGQVSAASTYLAGLPTVCDEGQSSFVEARTFAADGTVSETLNNNDELVGGVTPRTLFTYDLATHTLPAIVTREYTRAGAPAGLTRSFTHDLRFGEVATVTDENGVVWRTDFDALGRPIASFVDGAQVSLSTYDDVARPIERRTTSFPGDGPAITRTQYLDGLGRPRQTNVVTATGAIVEEWVAYDSFGAAAVQARPFELGADVFVASSAMAAPSIRARHDVFARSTATELPDGRVTSTVHDVGVAWETDARGIPTTTFLDAWGRVAAIDEHYAPASGGAMTAQRTTYARDALGRVYQVVDAAGHIRDFSYTERGLLSTTTPPHRPGEPAEPYTTCYDLRGLPIRAMTPAGREVVTVHDELGRPLSTTFSDGVDDTAYEYDSDDVPYGHGRLARMSNAVGSVTIAEYDARGNVASSVQEIEGDLEPWPSTIALRTSTTFDLLDRPRSITLPADDDGTFIATPVTATIEYDEVGRPILLAADGEKLVEATAFAPNGRVEAAAYANGLTELWTHDPLNGRVTSSFVDNGGTVLLDQDIAYDDNDNPTSIQRFFGAPAITEDPVVAKWFAYDTLDRLESATYDGVESTSITYAYAYGPTGNILAKDGFTYVYDGADPQAVARRVAGGTTETFDYDPDGQLLASTTGVGARDFSWADSGRLAELWIGPKSVTFAHGPDGARWLKRASDAADVYFGPLELRAHDHDDNPAAYFTLDLGSLTVQLALEMDPDGNLHRNAAADRYLHKDLLGSTVLVTSPDGTLTSNEGTAGRLDYTPFGSPLVEDASISTLHRRYTGKELDAESGLQYFGARYYDSELGRWISRDPLALTKAEWHLQEANLFGFVRNNPIAFRDPDGLQSMRGIRKLLPTPPDFLVDAADELSDKPETLIDRETLREVQSEIPTAIALVRQVPIFENLPAKAFAHPALRWALEEATYEVPVEQVAMIVPPGGRRADKLARVEADAERKAVLRGEKIYYENGKHGIKWTEGPALAKRGKAQGQWGSVADLDWAAEQANTLRPREGKIFALPKGHSSVVHLPDGTTVPATKAFIRNNGNGTFHGHPRITD